MNRQKNDQREKYPPASRASVPAITLLCIGVAAVGGSLPALAQQATPAEPILLDEISVSATALPTPLRQVASSVTVITAQDIAQRQWRTVTEALATVPGLNLVQTGSGGQTSLFMRGTNAGHVKVLIDGIDAGDPATPGRAFDFGPMLTAGIERIEVLRGPQGGLYGADALGGVVSITTTQGSGPPKASLMAEGGSFGTFNQQANIGGGDERFDYFFSAAHQRAEATPVTPQNIVPPGHRINDDFLDNWSFASRLGMRLHEDFKLTLINRYTDALLLNTVDSGFPSLPDEARSANRIKRYITRGEAVWSLWDNRFIQTFGAGYINEQRDYRSPATLSAPGSETSYTGERTMLDWQGALKLNEKHTLVFGAQHERERLDTNDLVASTDRRGVYAEWRGVFSDMLFLTANIRHDDSDDFGGKTTWRIAPLLVLPETGTRLKASVGTAYKAPSLSQLYIDYRPTFNFHGNPALKPETSTGYDIGIEQPLLDDKVTLGITYFHNDIKDLINSTYDSYENVGRATTSGIEAFAAFALTDRLDLRADYTFTLAKDDDARQELLRRPRHKGSITALWRPTDALTLSATALFVSSWIDGNRDFSVPRLQAPGYATINLAASYKATEQTELFARVDNLFDQRYENPTGYLQRGLGVYAGLRFTP